MCGGYTLSDPQAVTEAVRAIGAGKSFDAFKARYNVATTQDMPVVIGNEHGPELTTMHWGIVPFYARKNPKPLQLFNARSETIIEKQTFKQSVQKRRCVVPADGFYEWRREADGKTKTPFYIRLKGGAPFWFAGIYEDASKPYPAGYSLITTGPNELMQPIHDRMPVIFETEEAQAWLQPGPLTAEEVAVFCNSYPAARMQAAPVSSIVNNARNDVPECVIPSSGEINWEGVRFGESAAEHERKN